MSGTSTYSSILKEVRQDRQLRQPLLKKISEQRNGIAVVSFFISFYGQIPLAQDDADMLEEVLINTDTKNGVALLLDAPGGDGLAAERIIQICRTYANGKFETIVPSRAKSAATMICLGSDNIVMSPTSELGPIDPQVIMDLGSGYEWVATHHIVQSYRKLLAEAGETRGPIEPYLQQLASFNATKIDALEAASRLAEDIAVGSLATGMMNGIEKEEIRENIKPFTDPDLTLAHGRGIYPERASECGLNIDTISHDSELWQDIWSLYLRSKHVVQYQGDSPNKLIETSDESFYG